MTLVPFIFPFSICSLIAIAAPRLASKNLFLNSKKIKFRMIKKLKLRNFNHSSEILKLLKTTGYENLGLVPTMGSLHKGHLKLIEKCSLNCDKTIVSIFVNPTQFSNKIDFANYPQSIRKDVETIRKTNPSAIIYTPSESDLYTSPAKAEIFDLDGVDKLIEGKHRKGHFQGVATIVKRLVLNSISLPSFNKAKSTWYFFIFIFI